MKKMLLLSLLLATSVFAKQTFVLIDVGGGVYATIPVEIEEPTERTIKFIIGSKDRDRRGISSKGVEVVNESESGAIISSEDMLKHVKSVCLQVFVKDEYNPTFGKCSPVISGSYPIIEVDPGNIPDEDFSARLVGFKYQTNNWQWMGQGDIIAHTNSKIFESLFIQLGIDKVYMGNLYASEDMKSNMSFYNSKSGVDFTKFKNIFLVTNKGNKQTYDNSSREYNYTYAEFWINKGSIYTMICFDDTCYQIDEDFDFFNAYDIDVSELEEIEMIPVIGDDVCAVEYNQEFKKIIDVTNSDKHNKAYNYVNVEDCDKNYIIQVRVDSYRNLDTSVYGTGDFVIEENAGQVLFEIGTMNNSAWFHIEYETTDMKVDGLVFRPKMIVEIFDPETNEVVQTNKFDMTEFEFVGTGGKYCNQYMQADGLCKMVEIKLSVDKIFDYEDNLATLSLDITNHTDQPVILKVIDWSGNSHFSINLDQKNGEVDISTTDYGKKTLSSITFEVSFDGDGDQNYIEPYHLTVEGEFDLGEYTNEEVVCDSVMEGLGFCTIDTK